MTIDRKNILLFDPFHPFKYAPNFDYKNLGYTDDERLYVIKNFDQPGFDFTKYPIRFYWDLSTPFQEKKLRTFDCMLAGDGMTNGKAFLAHERLVECWHELLDKDLKILPAEFYTKNGQVTEFYLVQVLNKVYGLDLDLTSLILTDNGSRFVRYVPKAINDFMGGSQIALEYMWGRMSDFYIIPKFAEKTFKHLHKNKLRDATIMTFRERWELAYGGRIDIPLYTADYPGRSYRELGFPKDMEYY